MQQYQCLLVANECYQRGRMMTPTKIVVHSTAANNTSISPDGSSPKKGYGLRGRKQAMLFPLHEWRRPNGNNRLPSAFAT